LKCTIEEVLKEVALRMVTKRSKTKQGLERRILPSALSTLFTEADEQITVGPL
jgi:hypothetical protein